MVRFGYSTRICSRNVLVKCLSSVCSNSSQVVFSLVVLSLLKGHDPALLNRHLHLQSRVMCVGFSRGVVLPSVGHTPVLQHRVRTASCMASCVAFFVL